MTNNTLLREALEQWKCGSCGGSGLYTNRSFSAVEAAIVSDERQCKVCGGGGLNPIARQALSSPTDNGESVDPALVRHMVDRFLQWKLPSPFNPDNGIIFDPISSPGTQYQSVREPVGTNLFDAVQAEAMVRHMLEGAPLSPPPSDERTPAVDAREALRAEIINTPETADFMAGVPLEAAHQRERWGSPHDAGKTSYDWFWLIGYLAQKAAASQAAGDTKKAMHHTISTAAALANWHGQIAGLNDMRPGIGPDNGGEKVGSAAHMAAALSPSSDIGGETVPRRKRKLSDAPCDQCGYDGEGYYQPATHPCAAAHHGYATPAGDVERAPDGTPLTPMALLCMAGALDKAGMPNAAHYMRDAVAQINALATPSSGPQAITPASTSAPAQSDGGPDLTLKTSGAGER